MDCLFLSRTFSLVSKILRFAAEMKNVVFVLGAPGSGKGTQCEKIVHHFGYVHLSAGDLLRKERAKGNSKHHEILAHCAKNVKVVPSAITYSLIIDAIEQSNSQNFLIDAFPMNEENLSHWNREISNDVNLQFVLYLECPQDVCIGRCLKRGSGGSKRPDDNAEALKKRFDTFINNSLPVIEHFSDRNLLRKVCSNKDPNEVFAVVRSIFEALN